MLAITINMDFGDAKLVRSAQRKKSLVKDREVYERVLAKRAKGRTNSMPASYRLARPQRAARVVARSWLAKGEFEGETDMPTGADVADGSISERTSPTLISRCMEDYMIAARLAQEEQSMLEDESVQSTNDDYDVVNSDADTSVPEGADVADDSIYDAKLVRSAQRKKSLVKDREVYERVLAKRAKGRTNSMPASYRLARPQRAARVVARSWLAKGEVEGETDMPTVSIGHADHKPSASRLCVQGKPNDDDYDVVSSDADTSVPEGADVADDSISERTSPTLSFRCMEDYLIAARLAQEEPCMLEDESVQPTPTMLEEAISEDCPRSDCHECESISLQSRNPTLIESAEVDAVSQDARPLSPMPSKGAEVETMSQDMMQIRSPMLDAENTKATPVATIATTRREGILREVVTKLRNQAREAEQQAEEAMTRAEVIERKATSQRQKEEAAAKKHALQTEKQRAAELRRQRCHSAHIQDVTDKAARHLQEAAAIREQAETETISMRAQLFAEASREAQEQAEAQVQAELLAARAEVAALKRDSLDVAMQAQRMKVEAEAETQRLKVQAEKEAALVVVAKAEAEATRAEAQESARIIRGIALEDAAALKRRVEDQLREKIETQVKAHQEAQDKLVSETARIAELAAAEAQRETEATARHEKAEALKTEATARHEKAAALKLAKAMEQQRAQKMNKKAEQERHLEKVKCSELEMRKAKADDEERVMIERALSEVAAVHAQAEAVAHAARAQAHEKAEAEAATLRAEAEGVAAAIKAKAAWDADQLVIQAEAQAQLEQRVLRALASEQEVITQVDTTTEDPTSLDCVDLEEHVEEDWIDLEHVADGDWDVL